MINNKLRPLNRIPAVISPPGHLISQYGGTNNIQVAVTIDIRNTSRLRAGKSTPYRLFNPRDRIATVIPPPGYSVQIRRGTQNIGITVLIKIITIDLMGEVISASYCRLRPGYRITPVVPPPGNLLTVPGRTQNINIKITIDIRGKGGRRAVEISINNLFCPEDRGASVVPPPGYFAVIQGCSQNIHVSIPINITGVNPKSIIEVVFNGVFGENDLGRAERHSEHHHNNGNCKKNRIRFHDLPFLSKIKSYL